MGQVCRVRLRKLVAARRVAVRHLGALGPRKVGHEPRFEPSDVRLRDVVVLRDEDDNPRPEVLRFEGITTISLIIHYIFLIVNY